VRVIGILSAYLICFIFLCVRQQQAAEALCFQVAHPAVRPSIVRPLTTTLRLRRRRG